MARPQGLVILVPSTFNQRLGLNGGTRLIQTDELWRLGGMSFGLWRLARSGDRNIVVMSRFARLRHRRTVLEIQLRKARRGPVDRRVLIVVLYSTQDPELSRALDSKSDVRLVERFSTDPRSPWRATARSTHREFRAS